MTDYSKITALYSRLSVGATRTGTAANSNIQNQKYFWRTMPEGSTTNIRHYIDDDESGRFLTVRLLHHDGRCGKRENRCLHYERPHPLGGRDYLQVGNAMEIFRRNNVRFIAVNNGIDSEARLTMGCAHQYHRIGTQRTSARK